MPDLISPVAASPSGRNADAADLSQPDMSGTTSHPDFDSQEGAAMEDSDVVLVLGNAPDLMLAKRIAHVLVEEGLAACVNLGAVGLSMYMWQGVLEGAEEIPLTMKTTRKRLQALIKRLRQLHPYDVPEIIVVPVLGGLAAYLDWVREQTSGA